MESNDYISMNQMVSDVATNVGDHEMKLLDRGLYISRIQQAVEFFALHTFFQEVAVDFFDWNKGSNTFKIPTNCFNLRRAYLHNADNKCEDGCSSCSYDKTGMLSDYAVVHWKRVMDKGSVNKVTSRIKQFNNDAVIGYSSFDSMYISSRHNGTLVYAGLQSGYMVFGGDCEGYKNIRLVYNGLGSENGDIPLIPRILREGIVNKAELEILNVLKKTDRQYRADYLDSYNNFYGTGRNKGSFKRCKLAIDRMDTFKRESMKEYISNADFI